MSRYEEIENCINEIKVNDKYNYAAMVFELKTPYPYLKTVYTYIIIEADDVRYDREIKTFREMFNKYLFYYLEAFDNLFPGETVDEASKKAEEYIKSIGEMV